MKKKKVSLIMKITGIIFLLFMSVSIVFTVKAQQDIQKMILKNTDETANTVMNGVDSNFTNLYNEMQFALEPIIHNESIIQAFAERDREALSKLTLPTMEPLRKMGVEQFQFHLPDGTSFFRAHQPEKYGDDLSGFRATVVQANQQKKVVKGLEGGVAGAGIRYVIPIEYQGQHIGTVELGLGLNQQLLEYFKKQFDGEWFFYGIDGQTYSLLNSTTDQLPNLTLNEEQINQLKKMETLNLKDSSYQYLNIPLADFSGEVKWFIIRTSDLSEINQMILTQRISNLVFGFSIAVISILVSLYSARRFLINPIITIANQAKKVTEGDLSVKELKVKSNDEIGQLVHDFNEMTKHLKTLISHLLSTSQQVASTAEELTAGSEQTSKATEQIAKEIQDVAASIDQQASSTHRTFELVSDISQKMNEISAHTDLVKNSSLQAAKTAESGNEVVKKAIHYMELIQEEVGTSSDLVNSLGKKSKEIGEIISIITEIAEQTNLLALNAAIEAARAGEHGRGFAVVADEVRKLASESSDAAGRIRQLISAIQSETEKAVDSMNEGNQVVSEGIGTVKHAGNSFESIKREIDEVSSQIQDINSAIRQMDEGAQGMVAAVKEITNITEQVASNTQNVAAATEEQNASMEEVAAVAQMLSEVAVELNDSIKKFKV